LPQREALITSPSSEPEPAAWSRYQAVTAQTAFRMSCKGSKRARRRFSRCAGESSRRWRPRSRRRRSWRTTSRASSSSTGTTCRHRPTHT
jgi:hypothetical protein